MCGNSCVSTCIHNRASKEAEDRIFELEAKARELEDKLRFKQMDCDTWQRDAEGKLEDRTRLEHELTASRQQVERLKELWFSDADPLETEFRDEALAAVEKDRT